MNNRSTFERTLKGKALAAVALCAVVSAAVVGANAGPIDRPIAAADSPQPCPEDGSIACLDLWAEYIECRLGGGGMSCVVPCCNLDRDVLAQEN